LCTIRTTTPAVRLQAMCGIVGYVGSQQPSGRPLAVVLEGLRRLEYRGYDSAGVALTGIGDGTLATAKKAGKLVNLVEMLDADPLPASTAAIGHTRWATHGGPTDVNAHPHVVGDVAVIHNGIVENYVALRAELLADGATFVSETDTEARTTCTGTSPSP
jgi:glucosamine--fructose-6-phosphate aminotransferase (isomerizing)